MENTAIKGQGGIPIDEIVNRFQALPAGSSPNLGSGGSKPIQGLRIEGKHTDEALLWLIAYERIDLKIKYGKATAKPSRPSIESLSMGHFAGTLLDLRVDNNRDGPDGGPVDIAGVGSLGDLEDVEQDFEILG